MVSTNTLCKKLLNVKTAVIEGADFHADGDGVNHILIHARPNVWHKDDCPFCHKRCRRYDRKNPQPRIWRGLDWGGTLVEISYDTHRIECPEHGVLVADVPWAYPGSGFTKDFDLTVGWLATYPYIYSSLIHLTTPVFQFLNLPDYSIHLILLKTL